MARLAITYRAVENENMKRVHHTHPSFPRQEISETIRYAYEHLGEERLSLHFKERAEEKLVGVASPDELSNGEIIEAYLDEQGKRLCKVLVRVNQQGNRNDKVYVLALRERYGKVTVTYVTAYKNAANDSHRTLDRSLYYWGTLNPSVYN